MAKSKRKILDRTTTPLESYKKEGPKYLHGFFSRHKESPT